LLEKVSANAYFARGGLKVSIPKFDYPYLLPEKELPLSDETLGSLRPFEEFYSVLLPAIAQLFDNRRGGKKLLIPIDCSAALDDWLLSIYADAIEAFWRREFNSLLCEAQPRLRDFRDMVTGELQQREEISQYLGATTRRLGRAVTQVCPEIDSRQEIAELAKKSKALKEIEEFAASAIDPTLRNNYECELAKVSRYEPLFTRNRYSRRKNAADWYCDVIGMVEDKIAALFKILDLSTVSTRIGTFVVAFFDGAFSEAITEENVKTLRTRMRKRPKNFTV
jgi:hypothetical protein